MCTITHLGAISADVAADFSVDSRSIYRQYVSRYVARYPDKISNHKYETQEENPPNGQTFEK